MLYFNWDKHFYGAPAGDLLTLLHSIANPPIQTLSPTEIAQTIGISPNPTNEIAKVTCPAFSNGKANIQVFNQLGELVLEKNSQYQTDILLETKGLATGLYFMKIEVPSLGVVAKKLIVDR